MEKKRTPAVAVENKNNNVKAVELTAVEIKEY
ncbi:MAG: hypothetical protein QG610_2059 [Euryarchaeota archaeon]|nr:hypothetical protein [Euryarchaeota archaeon]